MKKVFTKVAFMMLAVMFQTSVYAQSEEMKWSIGLQGGVNQYNGDLGNGIYNFNQELYGFGGLYISRYLSPHFDIVADGNIG